MAVKVGKVVGLKQARDKLGRFMKTVESAPYKVLVEESIRMEREAKMETPIDTGALRESVQANVSGKGLSISLELTASATDETGYDYSNVQHENTTFRHPRGGKAFYLRDPFNRGIERIKERLSKEVKYVK